MKKHIIFISLMVLLFTSTFSSAAGTSASGINIAKGKPAKQSSTGWGGSASRGVDGNPNGQYNANSVTHTNQDQNAWWEVDLQSVYVLNSINVYNRTDCCSERLNGFRVITSINPLPNKPLSNTEINTLKHWDIKTAGKVSRINLGNVSGRYVRIQLIGRNYLSLAEVEVISGVRPSTRVGSTSQNIARNRPTRQSSTGYNGSASRGVDGNPNGQYNANSVTHTNQDQNAWWEVDLQSVQVLNSINVYNRTDCCGERLNGFRVITSTSPLPNKPLSNTEINALRHWDVKTAGKVSRINLGNVSGRYVRIQLIGRNYLSLAEVEVFGHP